MAAKPRINRARLRIWILWLILIALLCVYVLQIAHVVCTWRHRVVENDSSSLPALPVPLIREYENNGYLTVSSNGGLNQMRSGICDMVTVASFMNVTLIVPQLDNTSFWHDQSQFGDIFDVDHFIMSLRDEVRILKELPSHLKKKKENGTYVSMAPVSWSPMSFYLDKVLPQMKRHKLLHFTKTDARLANNGLPLEVQKLRCRVNYKALRFTPAIEKLGKKIIDILRKKGPFLVLHLRYEIDVLAFAGCNEGCTDDETEELRKLRYRISWWKEKEINSTAKRLAGLCPLTPEETVLTLKALDVDPSMQIYIAAGDAFGGERRLASLRATFPNLVKKETLLRPSDLLPFKSYSSQMAALDYIVSIESDVFFPTYGGNMAKVVEGHRRYLGFKKTIQPDKKLLVDLIDKYNNHKLSWEEFADLVKKSHFNRTGNPVRRVVIPGKPKEEDYFWSNPQECLPPLERRRTI